MATSSYILKKIGNSVAIAIFCLACSTPSQRSCDYETFMKSYNVSWNTTFNGTTIPALSLTSPKHATNNQRLQGKILLIEIWDSWNAPTRYITQKLDSVLGKYRGQQFEIVGINCQQETNTQHIERHWREKGYTFPIITNSDAFNQFIAYGNPSIVVIDAKGVVNGAWNNWNTTTMGEIEVLIASLLQETPYSLDEAMGYFENKEYFKALYHLEGVINTYPEDSEMLYRYKIRSLLNIDENNALAFANEWRNATSDSEKCLTEIATAIADINVNSEVINLYGAELFQILIEKHNKQNDPSCYDQMGRCLKRAGHITEALEVAKACFDIAFTQKIPSEELAVLMRTIVNYKELLKQ